MVAALMPGTIDRRGRTILGAMEAEFETGRAIIGGARRQLSSNKDNEKCLNDESVGDRDSGKAWPEPSGRAAALYPPDAHAKKLIGRARSIQVDACRFI